MSGAQMNKIEVKNVFKIFGPRADAALALIRQGRSKGEVLAQTGCVVGVNDLSLTIGAGEIFVIMGLSGSGKSTLVRHFNRLIDPTSGEILVDGEDILRYDMEALRQFRRRKISMVFQSFGLLPHERARQCRLRPEGSRRKPGAVPRAGPALDRHGGPEGLRSPIRTSFPAACASVSAWPARWPPTPRSFSWTRPSAPSTR